MVLFILLIYLLSFSTLLLTQKPPSQQSAPPNKGKGKAKATEDDKEEEATQKLRKELEDFVVPTTFDDKPLAAKAFLEWQGKLSQFFVLEGYKEKGKAKALLGDSEQAGAKQSFNDKEDEEDRVCAIKKIKHEHIEELTGAKKRKEIIELNEEVEIVAPKTPAAGPLHSTSKPIVLVPTGPSTAPIVPSSVPKPAAATALSKPAPAKSAGPAVKGGFIFKDPFMVRQFKLVGTEESGALIINQATEVLVTQGTMQSEESSDEDTQGDDDDSNNSDVAMNVDSTKHPEETWPVVLTKTSVTEFEAPAPVLPTKLKRTPFFKLHCTDKHIPFLLLGLQVPIQFEQN
ncbi:hypothetical protein C0995_004924 [Termitomyces sp. Mi166|nr:hypothetical protein C0995_004924 [Termitomyces sp. Mi166\